MKKSNWTHEDLRTTAEELSAGRLSRDKGWLQIIPIGSANLWINPSSLELCWHTEAGGLSIYSHEIERDFIHHFKEVAVAYAQFLKFPTLLAPETDPEMIARLTALGIELVLPREGDIQDEPQPEPEPEPGDGNVGSGNA